MKSRVILVILGILAVGVGVWISVTTGSGIPDQLVPAWQLLPKETYRAMGVTDPFLSWSPDSSSIIFSVFDRGSRRDKIFKWEVGEKKLEYITEGMSPNFVSNHEFLYLKRQPKGILLRRLNSGEEREVAKLLKKSEFFSEVIGFSYDPERKTITVRMAEWTRFRTLGPDEYDLSGKYLGEVSTRQSEGIVDYSFDPTGSRCAILVEEQPERSISLQIAKGKASRGREIARGELNAVAWSPDGRVIAYAEDKTVVAVRPNDLRRVVVGRFGNPNDEFDKRKAVRLIWSPNSRYMAVMVYVPNTKGDYPLYYVLDMSKLAW
ncbi:MAG: hypothetical protein N3B12_03235 [Armatimonadetes bacterium]|nr:hypothetical protein [Armatimonadota bacterium]